MEISSYASKRILSLGDYAFAEVDREVEKLRSKGISPIDFGVGDPTAELMFVGDPPGSGQRRFCRS